MGLDKRGSNHIQTVLLLLTYCICVRRNESDSVGAVQTPSIDCARANIIKVDITTSRYTETPHNMPLNVRRLNTYINIALPGINI